MVIEPEKDVIKSILRHANLCFFNGILGLFKGMFENTLEKPLNYPPNIKKATN